MNEFLKSSDFITFLLTAGIICAIFALFIFITKGK